MNQLTRSALALSVGFVGATIIFQAAEQGRPGDSEPVVLGQVDVFDYCHEVFGSNASALLVGGDAFGWRCSYRPNGVFLLSEINFDEACVLAYGNAVSSNWDESDPYAWECWET